MKALLNDLERQHPQLRNSMLAALGNVNPTHLLDRDLLGTAQPRAEELLRIRRFG